MFWLCSLFGGLLLLTVYLPVSRTKLGPEPTKEYGAYLKERSRVNSWLRSRGLSQDRVVFYEVLAGKRNISDVKKEKVRFAAHTLLRKTQPIRWETARDTRNFLYTHFSGYLYDYHNGYRFRGTLSILNDPDKVVRLMSRNHASVSSVLPEVPQEYREHPAFPEGKKKYEARPWWFSWFKWFLFSTIFAFGFFTSRATLLALGIDKKMPFSSSTESAFARLVVIGMVPGFLTLGAIHLLAPESRPTRLWFRRVVMRKSFTDEHEELISRLERMRKEADMLSKSEETLQMVDDALDQVRAAKNFEALSKLHRAAEGIKHTYEARAEVEKHLS